MSGILVVRNRQSQAIVVVIEPWGEERRLGQGQAVRVRYSSASIGELSIEASPGYISIYPWTQPPCLLEFLDEDSSATEPT
jgi:hypothetical protein